MIALPSLFCPSTVYIQTLVKHPKAIVYTGEVYQKQTLRNRCTLMTANGPTDFSIPVKKYTYPTPPTAEILLSEHGAWRHRLEQTLRSAYRSAPFWGHYEEQLLGLIYNENTLTLTGYNELWLEFICRVLDIAAPSSVIQLPTGADFRPEYGDPSFPSSVTMPRYWQVFEEKYGFISSVSALDLVLCEGPYAQATALNSIKG